MYKHRAECFRFEARRIIVMQGDPASAFYFILSGTGRY